MKFSWKGGETSPTQLQVHLSSCWSSPILACEERWTWTWTRVHLSWNCTRCTSQTSSPERSLRGGGELVCKVHQVQFQPNINKEVSKYPYAELARRGILGLPLSWHWDESVEVLPLFWSTSYEYTDNKGN